METKEKEKKETMLSEEEIANVTGKNDSYPCEERPKEHCLLVDKTCVWNGKDNKCQKPVKWILIH